MNKLIALLAALIVTVALTATGAAAQTTTETHRLAFNSPGTHQWTAPADATGDLRIHTWGAGGAAQGTVTVRHGGGGGGAYARSLVPIIPGKTYTVVVGAGANRLRAAGPSEVGDGTDAGVLVRAAAGASTTTRRGARGGTRADSIGEVRRPGGNGGKADTPGRGGGGGGAAGPSARGGHGEDWRPGVGAAGRGNGGEGGVSGGAGQSGFRPGGGAGGRGRSGALSARGGHGRVLLVWQTAPPPPPPDEEPPPPPPPDEEPPPPPSPGTPDTCPDCEPITDHGVRSDTPTADQTAAIRNAVATGKNLSFPPGIYCVNNRTYLRSGQTIEIREGASVRICGHHDSGLAVFMLNNVSNARLIGAGELQDTSGEGAGEGSRWRRFGVEIRGGSDNLVSGLTLRDFRSDGVYLESYYSTPRVDPQRITIRDVKTDAIERNGMTLNVGTDITVERLQCRNGVPPDVEGKFGANGIVGACLFFEPNLTDQPLTGITIDDLYAEDNSTAVTFGAVWHNENSPAVDVAFNRPVSVRDRRSFDIRNNFLGVPGTLRFTGARSFDARWEAVNHYRTNGRGFQTTFTDLEIVRYGSDGGPNNHAVIAFADGTSRTDIQPDYPFGNLRLHFAHAPTRHPSASGTAVLVTDNRNAVQAGGCIDIFLENATGVELDGNATSCVTRS